MAGGKEFYTIDDGEKADAELHEPILANAKADLLFAEQAIKDAVAAGTPESVARELYGV